MRARARKSSGPDQHAPRRRPRSDRGERAEGGQLSLGREPFCFLGTNNYYVSYKSHRMTDDLLESARSLGLKVIRVWGYIDRGALDGSMPDVDADAAKRGVYFQYWDPVAKRPAYNDGPTGLEHLDYLLDRAHRLDLKIMVVLTNNWRDFGGIDQYVAWYGQKQHHLFYQDSTLRGAFKDWAAHLIGRKNSISGVVYRDDPTIFGWELANEPRCTNGKGFDDPTNGCASEIVTNWASDVTGFIKSIDKNHLVSVGDEGFFARGKGSGFGYDGSEGVDHTALLGLPNVDFGTYHLYPDTWVQGLTSGPARGSTSIFPAPKMRASQLSSKSMAFRCCARLRVLRSSPSDASAPSRVGTSSCKSVGEYGSLVWMLAAGDDEHGFYPDYDHFTIYAGEGATSTLARQSGTFGQSAQACLGSRGSAGPPGPPSPFVTVSRTLTGRIEPCDSCRDARRGDRVHLKT